MNHFRMLGIIRKKSNNVNALRTNEMKGNFVNPPAVGEGFSIYGAPLVEGNVRMILTSPVTEVHETTEGYLFRTENSTYELELIKNG